MRFFISIALILSFCFLSLRSVMVFSYFKYNQEYITANFCINKEVKESSCHGSCQFKKMMDAEQTKNQVPGLPIIPNFQLEEFFPLLDNMNLWGYSSNDDQSNKNFVYQLPDDRLAVYGLFHPPRLFL